MLIIKFDLLFFSVLIMSLLHKTIFCDRMMKNIEITDHLGKKVEKNIILAMPKFNTFPAKFVP